MKQILMCPPTNFGVQYEINPWMKGHIGDTDKFRVAQQWSVLRNELIAAGAQVTCSPTPPENCPDAVFMANAGLIYKDTFIPSEFKHPERQVEEPYFQEWFENLDFEVITRSRDHLSFEGAGDALFSSNRQNLWMGYGFRSSGDYKFYLDRVFEDTDVIIRPLQLVDPRWYHLDTCFCPLDTGELLWYPGAFSPEARAAIELWYDGKDIKVSEEDALRFACNAVSIEETIILPNVSDELDEALSARGYNVVMVNMDQFLRSGGACKCLTIEVIE